MLFKSCAFTAISYCAVRQCQALQTGRRAKMQPEKKLAVTPSWAMSTKELDDVIERIRENNTVNALRDFQADIPYLRPKENLALLTHYREVEFQLMRLLIGWIPTMEKFEVKMDLARQGYICTQ